MPFVSCAALDASQAPQDAAIAALQASQTAQDATIAALQAGAPVTASEVAAAVDAMTPAQLADMCAKLNCPLSAAALTAALLALPGAGVAGNVLTIVGGAPVFQAPVPGPATSVPAAGVQAGTLAPAVQINDTANFGAGAAATDTALGVVENATTAEVSAGVLDGAVAISPKNLLDGLNAPGALKSAVSAIAAAAAPPPPVATDTVAGITTLNQGTAAGDATDCNSALTACGLTAILNGTAPNASPNPLQLAVAQLPAKHIVYFPMSEDPGPGYLLADGQPTTGCANAAATWGANTPNLYAAPIPVFTDFNEGPLLDGVQGLIRIQNGPFAGQYLAGSVANAAASAASVIRVSADGATAVVFGTGVSQPLGVAEITSGPFAGDFLVVGHTQGAVFRIPAAGGAAVPFSTGYTFPIGLCALTSGPFAGDFLVASFSDGQVRRIPNAGGAPVLFSSVPLPLSVFQIPAGPFAGDILVGTQGNVRRIPAAGGASVPFATGGSTFTFSQMTLGAFAGDFIGDKGNRIPAAGGATVPYFNLTNAGPSLEITDGPFAGDYLLGMANDDGGLRRATMPDIAVPYVKC